MPTGRRRRPRELPPGRGEGDVLGLQRAVGLGRVVEVGVVEARVLLGGEAGRAGEEDADAADELTPSLKIGMPPGSVPMPRDCGVGQQARDRSRRTRAASIAAGRGGMNCGSMLNRLGSGMSSAVPRMRSGPGLMMLSRLVCSISNRSTCGVNMTRGGKWPLDADRRRRSRGRGASSSGR